MPWRARAALLLLFCGIPSCTSSCGAPPVDDGAAATARVRAWVRAQAEERAARARMESEPPPIVVAQRAPAQQGTIPLVLTADGGPVEAPRAPLPLPQAQQAQQAAPTREAPPGAGVQETVVSLGVPFPPGAIRDPALIAVRHGKGAAVPAHVAPLATWPRDGSIRSALVAFRVKLPPGQQDLYQIAWGTPGGAGQRAAEPLAPNPDGPVAATLPAAWYARSQVSGPHVPALDNQRFAGFEERIEQGLERMSPAFDALGVSCSGQHRTYYDSPHALYQRFLRYGDAARYRRARAEARWYRDNELRWSPDRAFAVHVCEPQDWTPARPMAWGSIRRMVAQGLLDDYLLTGDPASKEAIAGMGEALRRALPAFVTPKEDALQASERNMAFAIMILAGSYAVDPRPEVLAALKDLVDRTAAWQARGDSGAFEHDLHRVDPGECERGPRGASPFMTALLVDALMDVHALTGDPRIAAIVARAARWLEEKALTSDRMAFRYLWNCETDSYDDSGTADLNLLIVPVFGAAYALSGDPRWLRTGDALADIGVKRMRAKSPKHWCQSMRGFGRYLGYRSLSTLTPPTLGGSASQQPAPAPPAPAPPAPVSP